MDSRKNPYIDRNSPPRLKRSVLAYVDMLGYLEMAEEAERLNRENEVLVKLHKAIREHRGWLEGHSLVDLKDKELFAVKAFTDNIIIGWPISGDGEMELGHAFLALKIFQLNMVLSGFFIRGGISIGNAYIDDIAVFGAGVNEAYKTESCIARDPRIVLSESAVDAIMQYIQFYPDPERSPQNHDILIDVDGRYFINYLNGILIAVDERGPYFKELARHKRIIEYNLMKYSSLPQIWSKYAWAANYHNYFCDLHAEFFAPTCKIDWERFRMHPKQLVDRQPRQR